MNTTALILGMGSSGEAAAKLLLREGVRVTVVDAAQSAALESRAAQLRLAGAEVLLGCNDLPPGTWAQCVISPGLSLSSPWILRLAEAGTELIPELELGAARCRCPVLAITGSNGKSSLTKLCCEALTAAGRRAVAGANYGEPLCDIAPRTGGLDWVVAEASSFQLEATRAFRPAVGILLNLRPNHLNRHGTMAAYKAAKCRLFAHMRPGDVGIVLDEHLEEARRLSGGACRWVGFGLSPAADYRYEDGAILFGRGLDRQSVSIAGSWFDNRVFGVSAAAAVAAMQACGVDAEAAGEAIRRFEPLPHRRQVIATVRGVRFVDDSKATNLAAVQGALDMAPDGVRLIAGGQLKETDLEEIKQVLASKVRGAYLIGEAAERMFAAWSDVVPCRQCGTLERAVNAAWLDAQSGEEVLLSTGCASFDQFKNYEERGACFSRLAKTISKGDS